MEEDSSNELLVFGYACKLFRDDQKAMDVEKALIPWMGSEEILIDRYDGRGHLSSLSHVESKPGLWSEYFEQMSSEERLEEQMAEEERYRSLNEEAIEAHAEIMKRAAAVPGNYSEIGFNYDEGASETDVVAGVEEKPEDFTDPADLKPFKPPKGLNIPVTVPRPETMREHAIIEKTAEFIAKHGDQMEVIIKTKQAKNPQFKFLDIEHKLNLYYRFLIAQIKSGSFKPCEESDSDSDSEDGSYLHPSLFAKKQNDQQQKKDTLAVLFKTNKQNCAYSQLINKIKPEAAAQEAEEAASASNEAYGAYGLEAVIVPPPPPDQQPIVDKMAEYVAKNGKDFEDTIRSKGDAKFAFIHEHHEYHAYYQQRLYEFQVYYGTLPMEPEHVPCVTQSESSPMETDGEASSSTVTTKKKSLNALEKLGLECSDLTTPEKETTRSSSQKEHKPREKSKKKMKISLKQDSNTPIGPSFPQLYDDDDPVEIANKEDVMILDDPIDEIEKFPLTKENISQEFNSHKSEDRKSHREDGKVKDDRSNSQVLETSVNTSLINAVINTPTKRVEKRLSSDNSEDDVKRKQLERRQKLQAFMAKMKGGGEEEKSSNGHDKSQKSSVKANIKHLKKVITHSDEELFGDADSKGVVLNDESPKLTLPVLKVDICRDDRRAERSSPMKEKVNIKKLKEEVTSSLHDDEYRRTKRRSPDSDEEERRRRRKRRSRSKSRDRSRSRQRDRRRSRDRDSKEKKRRRNSRSRRYSADSSDEERNRKKHKSKSSRRDRD